MVGTVGRGGDGAAKGQISPSVRRRVGFALSGLWTLTGDGCAGTFQFERQWKGQIVVAEYSKTGGGRALDLANRHPEWIGAAFKVTSGFRSGTLGI